MRAPSSSTTMLRGHKACGSALQALDWLARRAFAAAVSLSAACVVRLSPAARAGRSKLPPCQLSSPSLPLVQILTNGFRRWQLLPSRVGSFAELAFLSSARANAPDSLRSALASSNSSYEGGRPARCDCSARYTPVVAELTDQPSASAGII